MIELGDFIKMAKKLPSNSFDVIICDPPYNIGKDFGNNKTKKQLHEYLIWCDLWIDECVRLLKGSGTMYLYGFPEICAHISVRLPLEHRWLTWHYTNKNTAKASFWVRSQETILTAWKDKKTRVFNIDAAREPYGEVYLRQAGKKRAATPGRLSNGTKETIYNVHPDGAYGRDVIKISALAGGSGSVERMRYCKTCGNLVFGRAKRDHVKHNLVEHPTQKPIKLTMRLLEATSPLRHGKLLVPFAGTGIELKVAKELGFETIGFDLNPDYVNMGNELLGSDIKVMSLIKK